MHCCHLEVLSLTNPDFNVVSTEMRSVSPSQNCVITVDQDVTQLLSYSGV